jgi:hypothetical protein
MKTSGFDSLIKGQRYINTLPWRDLNFQIKSSMMLEFPGALKNFSPDTSFSWK